MKRILTAILLIAAVLLVIFLPQPEQLFVNIAATIVALLALYEYTRLASARGVHVPARFILPAGLLLFFNMLLPPSLHMTFVTLLALCLLAWASFTSPVESVLPNAAYGIFGLLWIVCPCLILPQMRAEYGPAMLLYLFVVVWSGDIAALYIGRRFGRRKLAPKLSPNKTWVGAIASAIGSVLCALLLIFGGNALNYYTGSTILVINEPVLSLAILAFVVNIAAQVGDLIESAVKRGAGVKDSGALLPGHGGILDRIDALLLATPVLWYALQLKDSYLFSRFSR
jgi:phosphatidate cytidylyltransferase